MTECFGIFSKVIALVCMGSQCTAGGTLLLSHRRVGVGLALARAEEIGEASTTQLAHLPRLIGALLSGGSCLCRCHGLSAWLSIFRVTASTPVWKPNLLIVASQSVAS